MFDLFLLTLNIVSGKEQSDLPGLLVSPAPRRCERSRSGDLLLALLSLSGSLQLSQEQVDSLLQDLAGSYFSARGSATAGLRAAAEQLNSLLLKSNLENARQGLQTIGMINLALLRRETLYLAQAGATQSFVLSGDDVRSCGDPAAGSRSLGLSRNVSLQFQQALIQAGDLLLMSPNPPPTWNEAALAGSPQLTFEQLRRRLLNQAGEEHRSVVIQFQEGKGVVHRLKPRAPVQTTDQQEVKPETSTAAPAPEKPAAPTKAPSFPESLPERPADAPAVRKESQEQSQPPGESSATPIEEPAGSVSYIAAKPTIPPDPIDLEALFERQQDKTSAGSRPEGVYIGGGTIPGAKPPSPEERRRPAAASPRRTVRQSTPQPAAPRATPPPPRAENSRLINANLHKKMAAAWFSGRAAGSRLKQGIETFGGRILPAATGRQAGLSGSTMIFIAIAVPLVIAAIATTIYFRSGWREQHYYYLQEAQKYAAQAMAQDDPTLQGNLWNLSLKQLDRAEEYGKTDESHTLREQVQQSTDRLEGVLRLDLIPALSSPFSPTVDITDLAVTSNSDVYLLDRSEGRILRMFTTAKGYEVDPAFKCGPGLAGSLQVGPLVDLVSLDFRNKFGAAILASDAQGNLLYCIPGDEPISRSLPVTNNADWSNITAIARDELMDSLYVADPGRKMVVYFDGDQGAYDLEAHNAFDNYFPIGLDSVSDLAFNEDLFILYSNGKLAWCTQRNYTFANVDCKDPAAFGDSRANRKSDVAIFPNAKFIKLLASEPPDPALYILEQNESTIYLFSLKLNLQYLLKPHFEEGFMSNRPLSALAIAPGRIGIFAFGNQVYTATLP